jgi:undecaprenyl-diphosphatase
MAWPLLEKLRSFRVRHTLLLGAALVIVLGTWGLIGLTDAVEEGHTDRFDHRVILWMVHHPGPQWLQDCGRDLTALGGVTVLALVVMAVIGYLLLARKRRAAVLVIVAVAGGLIISTAIKRIVNRPRPPREYQSAYVFTASFPSGHSMLSAVTYLTLGALLAQVTRGRVLKVYFVLIAVLVTFLVGVSRVYLRVHWPTDVLAGWTGGLVWSMLCLSVSRWLQRRGAMESELEKAPSGYD